MRESALRSTRLLQFAFLVLLGVSAAQVLWWLLDQVSYSARVEERLLERWDADRAMAGRLLDRGAASAGLARELAEDYPHLTILDTPSGRQVIVDPAARERLHEERRRHLRQYLWEGGFFLIVLLLAMVVVYRVLRQEADLLRRQQNFLAAVTHELKSPLASLQLATETMVLRELTREKRAELLERNREDLRRLDQLITNLLDSSRLDEGRVALVSVPVSLRSALDEAASDLVPAAPDQDRGGPRLELDVPAELMLRADPLALRSVLRNLLDNAVKASAATEHAEIRVAAEAQGGTVRVQVEDRGVGFEPHEAERLFEKFYRRGEELRRRDRGTGLGLYLARRFTELQGGTLTASSAGPGQGATFTLSWPRSEPA